MYEPQVDDYVRWTNELGQVHEGWGSALAADALQQMGYTRVSSLAGGWRAWNAADGPVKTP